MSYFFTDRGLSEIATFYGKSFSSSNEVHARNEEAKRKAQQKDLDISKSAASMPPAPEFEVSDKCCSKYYSLRLEIYNLIGFLDSHLIMAGAEKRLAPSREERFALGVDINCHEDFKARLVAILQAHGGELA